MTAIAEGPTLASALAVYRLSSRRPTTLSEEERAVQPMGSFRNCLEGVSFRLRYGGREVSAEEADGLRDQESGIGDPETEVSPDSMITCPKCHKRFRVGKKQG